MNNFKTLRHFVEKKALLDKENKTPVVLEEEFRVCEVCGHANHISLSQCEMCSNYLEEEGNK